MPTDPLQPFTEEQFREMDEALKRADQNEKAIKKAQRAGVDLPDQLQENRDVAAKLRQILNTYRPR